MTDVTELYPLVISLTNPSEREGALVELSKKREQFPDLAPVLWHSFGVIAALLQEILSKNDVNFLLCVCRLFLF
jgi:CCR4-NOT transcription complex subunit 9